MLETCQFHFLLLSPPSSRCTDNGVANNDLLWLLFVIMKVLAVLGVGKRLFHWWKQLQVPIFMSFLHPFFFIYFRLFRLLRRLHRAVDGGGIANDEEVLDALWVGKRLILLLETFLSSDFHFSCHFEFQFFRGLLFCFLLNARRA